MNVTLWMTVVVICAGQLGAIGVHCFAWWLRRKALWLLGTAGLLGALVLGGMTLLLMVLVSAGDWEKPQSDADSRRQLLYCGVTLGALLLVPACIGLLHAWQMKPHWRARLQMWLPATLCVWGEVALGVLLLSRVNSYFYSGKSPSILPNAYSLALGAFGITFGVLMLFRPLVLKFVRPLLPMVQRATGLHVAPNPPWEAAPDDASACSRLPAILWISDEPIKQ